MPSIDGGDSTTPEYAPHMWLGGHFIHNTQQRVKVGDWWYRGGRFEDERIVAERWKGDEFSHQKQTDRQMVSTEQIPPELLLAMSSVSRAEQEAFQRGVEREFGPPR